MNRSFAAVAIAGGALGAIGVLTSTVVAQVDEEDSAERGTVEMHLVDQSFDLEPNGTIDLVYELTGELAAVADLAPPTTTPPSTAPPTTAPPTAPPTTPPPVDDGSVSAPTPPATVAPPPTVAATTTTIVPAPPIVARVVNYARLTDPNGLDGLLGPRPPLGRFSGAIDGVDIVDVRPDITVGDDGTAELRLSIPTDSDPSVAERLQFDRSGIYPVTVQLIVDGSDIASHATAVEFRARDGDAPPTIALSLLAATPDPGIDADDEQIDPGVARFGEFVTVAEAVDAPFALLVPPTIATAAAPDAATAALLSDDELLASPIAPFDVSSAVEVDRLDAFDADLLAGEAAVRAALPRVPIRREVWLTTSPLSGSAAAQLRDRGVRFLAMTPSVYRSSVTADGDEPLPDRDRLVELDLPDGGTMPVLLLDDQLGSTFTTERTDEILAARTPTEWAIGTLATLRLEQLDAPFGERSDARSHLLATPDLTAPDPRLLTELVDAAESSDAIAFVPASLLGSITATQPTPDAATLPDRAGPPLEQRLATIRLIDDSLADAASMLPDGDEQIDRWRGELDELVTTSYSEADAQELFVTLQQRAEEIRGAVIAPEPFTFTLTGPSTIDVRVGNRLDEPLIVVLRLTSERLDFPDGAQTVTLEPDGPTEIPVRVEPRSNGTSRVTVDILSPLGQRPLVEPVTLTSRVTALTGLGQVLTGALVLILLTWWISNWRRRRREGDDEPSPDTDDTDTSGADTDAGDDGDDEVPAAR